MTACTLSRAVIWPYVAGGGGIRGKASWCVRQMRHPVVHGWHQYTCSSRFAWSLAASFSKGTLQSWLVFPFVSPSILGSGIVCHPVLLLSWVRAESRRFVCARIQPGRVLSTNPWGPSQQGRGCQVCQEGFTCCSVAFLPF